MRTHFKPIAVAFLGLFLSLSPLQASETTQADNIFNLANPMTWFNMTNQGQMSHAYGEGFTFHPLKPAHWAAIASPQQHEAFHMAMTNPATYTYYMQPAFYMEFMNPANYLAWMNPTSYQTFLDPATFNYWMTPDAYTHFFNPDMYAGMFNMNNYFAWMNPSTYFSWMNPAQYLAVATPQIPPTDSVNNGNADQ